MHRLIPSKYSEGGTVLEEVADNDAMLADMILLDGATNDRVQGEQHGLSGITPYELVYGIANARIVNAAFTHTSDSGSRFNDQTRGAWYAAYELETSIAEVSYHKARRLSDIVAPYLPDHRPDHDVSTYDDWLADFRTTFHVLDPADQFPDYLRAEPVPGCYLAPQRLCRQLLLQERSNGIVYPIVRREDSLCVACFRPDLVYNPRLDSRFEIRLTATDTGYEHQARVVPIR